MNEPMPTPQLDEALRALFAPPADLARRAAAMVGPLPAPVAPRRRWLLLAAAAVFLPALAWLVARPATAPRVPAMVVAAEDLMADEVEAFALPTQVNACTTHPGGSTTPTPTLVTPMPGLPLEPRPDEVFAGPLPCLQIPGALRYWRRGPDGSALVLVLPTGWNGAIEVLGGSTVERQLGERRVIVVSRAGFGVADGCASRLR